MIVILETGLRNFSSLKSMMRKLGADVWMVNDSHASHAFDAIVLQDVVWFDKGMTRLHGFGTR